MAKTPSTNPTNKARLILQPATASVKSFNDAFDNVRAYRGAGKGMTTDEDQDLLRAMLVFAAAGLDSTTKQLIRNTLPLLLAKDPTVQKKFEEFVARRLRGEEEDSEGVTGRKFLARIVASAQPRAQLIEEYVRDLTGSSLQSPDELMRAASALGIDPRQAGIDPKQLRPIFEIRNKIIHELDIDLGGQRRKRVVRGRDPLLKDSKTLLQVAENLVASVETKLATAQQGDRAESALAATISVA